MHIQENKVLSIIKKDLAMQRNKLNSIKLGLNARAERAFPFYLGQDRREYKDLSPYIFLRVGSSSWEFEWVKMKVICQLQRRKLTQDALNLVFV